MSQMLQMFQQAGAAQFSAMIGQVAPTSPASPRRWSSCAPAMPRSASPNAVKC